MKINSIQNAAERIEKKLDDESRLCFGAAAGCFLVGSLGWLINLVRPDTTLLDGLLVIAAFYCFLGFVQLVKPTASTVDAANDGDGIAVGSTGVPADKTVKSAA